MEIHLYQILKGKRFINNKLFFHYFFQLLIVLWVFLQYLVW